MVRKLSLSLVVVLFVALVSLPALAASNGQIHPGFEKKLDRANSLIENQIGQTIDRADQIMEGRKDGTAFKNADEQLVRLANGLLNRTGYILAAIQREAAKLGIPLEVSYIPVRIGNTIVLVDPLRVCAD